MKADISLHDNEEKMKELFMDIFIKKDLTRMLNRDVLHTDKTRHVCRFKGGNRRIEGENENIEEETIGTFIPNYVDVYTSCVAIPGFSFDKCEIPGFQLVKLRAERTLTEMGTRLVNTVVNDKKQRWRKDIASLTSRGRNVKESSAKENKMTRSQ